MVRYLLVLFLRGFYFSAAATAGAVLYGYLAHTPFSALTLATAHFITFALIIAFAVLVGGGVSSHTVPRNQISAIPNNTQNNAKYQIKYSDAEFALSFRLFVMSLLPLTVGLIVHFIFV